MIRHDFIKTPITTREEALKFIRQMDTANLTYHWDEPAENIITRGSHALPPLELNNYGRVFTDEEAMELNKRTAEMAKLTDIEWNDVFGFSLILGDARYWTQKISAGESVSPPEEDQVQAASIEKPFTGAPTWQDIYAHLYK